jgi:hypothetical protein
VWQERDDFARVSFASRRSSSASVRWSADLQGTRAKIWRGKAREQGWKGMGSRRGKDAPDSTVASGEGMGAATAPPRGARETRCESKRRAKERKKDARRLGRYVGKRTRSKCNICPQKFSNHSFSSSQSTLV